MNNNLAFNQNIINKYIYIYIYVNYFIGCCSISAKLLWRLGLYSTTTSLPIEK